MNDYELFSITILGRKFRIGDMIVILLLLIFLLVLFRDPCHACEVTPGDWEAIEEEIAQNGK